MGENLTTPQTEISSKGSQEFKDLVIQRQTEWEQHKKRGLKALGATSQSINLPESFTSSVFSTIIQNLPEYIPENLKTKIVGAHPKPIIGVGVLKDDRFLADKYESTIEGTENIPDQDRQNWLDGMEMLNELATDLLTQDILETYSQKKPDINTAWSKLANYVKRNSWRAGSKAVLTNITKQFGGEDALTEFRQALVTTYLSGDKENLNNILIQRGYNNGLQDFAISIGKLGVASKTSGLSITPGESRILESLKVQARSSLQYPGVIQLSPSPLALTAVSAAAAAGSGVIAYEGIKLDSTAVAVIALSAMTYNVYQTSKNLPTTPYLTIHEVCHYLSQNTNKTGLFEINR